jgi:protein phosphatase
VPALSIRFAEESNIGLRKKEQQDYQGHLYIGPEAHPEGPLCLFIVCDGVSMGAAGALASRTAVELTLHDFPLRLEQGLEPVLALKAALETANAEVVHLEQERPGMATTCVAALLMGNQVVVAHMGDSRAYLVRADFPIKMLTTDHSWTEEVGRGLVRQGYMTEDELNHDNRRHSITRALGLRNELNFDFSQHLIQPSDRILLCSDGLWDAVEPEVLQNLAVFGQGNQDEQMLAQAAHQLVEAALSAGGRDNITVSLLEIDEVGQALHSLALTELVETTVRSTKQRTGQPLEDTLDESEKPTVIVKIPVLPVNPSSVEASSTLEETREIKLSSNPVIPFVQRNYVSPENSEIESVMSPVGEQPQLNLDSLFKKVQKLYAIGNFDEAVSLMIELEQENPERPSLQEMLSNSLVRVVGSALTRYDLSYATALMDELEQANIIRYREMLFEFCLQESLEAEQARNYLLVRDYATLALQLRPNDGRARQLQELSEAYLNFQDEKLSLAEKLNLGQNLYARNPDFGGIQDDLALIYLEMGDQASDVGIDNEALGWYQLIRSLRVRDARISSLAMSKSRAVEDKLERLAEQAEAEKELEFINTVSMPIEVLPSSERAAPTTEKSEVRVDIDEINRLKERVSRAQKAWDNGRREVGSEYIYAVEQLTVVLSPNPWQTNYPRVCYDYGKWLFEQEQYIEATPYLKKARTNGVSAAHQKLKEIERLTNEATRDEVEPMTRSLELASTGRVAAQPETSYNNGSNSNNFNQFNRPIPPLMTRQPLIIPLSETPPTKNFVGASHAGDGVLNPNRSRGGTGNLRPLNLNSSDLVNSSEIQEFNYGAGSADSGPEQPLEPVSPTEAQPIRVRPEKYLKPERSVGATGLRTTFNEGSNRAIQSAVARELNRLNTTGNPQYVAPKRAAQRRTQASLDLLRNLWLPSLIVVIVVAATIALLLNILNSKSQPVAQTVVPLTATTTPDLTTVATVTPIVSPKPTLMLVQAHLNIKLTGVNADNFDMLLGLDTDNVSNLTQMTPGDNGSFGLSSIELSKLDLSKKYTVVVRPKDTDVRKYKSDLPLSNPAIAMYVQRSLSFDKGNSLNATFTLTPQAINFYPLDLGDQDIAAAPGGGHYYAGTHHIIRSDYQNFYDKTGGFKRWGYPLSEEFDQSDLGHVQFYERGWLIRKSDATFVIGSAGKLLLSSPCLVKPDPVQPPASTSSANSLASANSFVVFVNKNGLGRPTSDFFFVTSGSTKKLMQYFEYGRLELLQNDKTATIEYGLVGTEYTHCQGWTS